MLFRSVLDSEGGSPGQGNSQPVLQVRTKAMNAELQQLQQTVDAARQQVEVARLTAPERMAAWETETRRRLQSEEPAWRQLAISSAVSKGGAELTRQSDGSWLASGKNPESGLVEIVELAHHPFFIGVQYHPELKSTVENPQPVFVHFIKAAFDYARQKNVLKNPLLQGEMI